MLNVSPETTAVLYMIAAPIATLVVVFGLWVLDEDRRSRNRRKETHMIPYVITPEQARIARIYWGCDWTYLSASQVQEALDWWYGEEDE